MKRTSVRERVTINLALPKSGDVLKHALMSGEAIEFYSGANGWYLNLGSFSSGASASVLMNALSPNISQDDFIRYFPDYFMIAKAASDPNQAKLRDFCKKYLIGHRHVALDKQPTNIPLLVNVLYRTCCLRNKGNIYHYSTLSGIAKELKQINDVVPIEINQVSDVYDECLKDSREIFETLLSETPPPSPSMPSPIDSRHEPAHVLLQQLSLTTDALDAFYQAYQSGDSQYDATLQEILTALPEHPTFEQLRVAEAEAGACQYRALVAQQQASEHLTPELLAPLESAIQTCNDAWQRALDEQWDLTYAEAIKEPSEPVEAERVGIARRTLQQPALTKKIY